MNVVQGVGSEGLLLSIATPLPDHLQSGQDGQPQHVAARTVAALAPSATNSTSASEYSFLITISFHQS
jgi:hypothetical protein